MFYIGEVRNIEDDDTKSGRVRLRAYTNQYDESQIKDEDLPWALVLMPTTSASTNKHGIIPTGMEVGSRVLYCYAENDHKKQFPIILGSFYRAVPPTIPENQSDAAHDTKSEVPEDKRGMDTPAPGNPGPNNKGSLTARNKKATPEKIDYIVV